MLDIVEVSRDLSEEGVQAPVVSEVHQDQGQEGRGRQHGHQWREREAGTLVPDVGLRFDVASLRLGSVCKDKSFWCCRQNQSRAP